MDIAESFITDASGSIKSVIINYATFKKIEQILLDEGLARAMTEIQDEEEVDLEEAKILLASDEGFSKATAFPRTTRKLKSGSGRQLNRDL